MKTMQASFYACLGSFHGLVVAIHVTKQSPQIARVANLSLLNREESQ